MEIRNASIAGRGHRSAESDGRMLSTAVPARQLKGDSNKFLFPTECFPRNHRSVEDRSAPMGIEWLSATYKTTRIGQQRLRRMLQYPGADARFTITLIL